MTRVGIVGAGITGLALTHSLAERGVEVVTFEADTEPGGVIRSTRRDGRVLEHGPQRLRLTPAVDALVDALGLRDELVIAEPSLPVYVYCDGRLREAPLSPRAFVRTDLLSPLGKLRTLAEPLTAPGRPDETAAALFRRKFGDEAARNLLEPLFGGMYGSDPARMPARHALAGLLEREDRRGGLLRAAVGRALKGDRPPAASFASGLQRLPRALSTAHADRVRLGAAVTRIEADGDAYRLIADGDAATVDEVVITATADAAAGVLDGPAPDAADRLRRLRYNPLAIVHVRADARARGMGYQVREDEGLATLGVTWNASLFGRDGVPASGGSSQVWGRDGVYTCFLGGMRDPELVARSDDALGALATREFAAVMGADAEALGVTRLPRGFPAYDRSWDALDGLTLPDGVSLATNYTARMGIPSRIREAGSLAASLAPDG